MTNFEKCKLGFFYFDTSDKRVVVPKLSKWGWTLNVGNTYTYVLIILVVAILIGFSLFGSE